MINKREKENNKSLVRTGTRIGMSFGPGLSKTTKPFTSACIVFFIIIMLSIIYEKKKNPNVKIIKSIKENILVSLWLGGFTIGILTYFYLKQFNKANIKLSFIVMVLTGIWFLLCLTIIILKNSKEYLLELIWFIILIAIIGYYIYLLDFKIVSGREVRHILKFVGIAWTILGIIILSIRGIKRKREKDKIINIYRNRFDNYRN